jgi:hypothetical protein
MPRTTGKHDGNSMNMKRMRGRNHRSGGGGGGGGNGGGGGGGGMRHHATGGGIPLNRNHVFDSNGPDIRVRGTAQQLFEKYLQLGRDATSGGDRVMAEGYLQYAEHYFRVLNLMNQAAAQQGQGGGQGNGQGGGQMNGHQGGGQQRYRQGYQNGEEAPQMSSPEPEEAEIRAPGMGDQPEAREIPITTTPPEE